MLFSWAKYSVLRGSKSQNTQRPARGLSVPPYTDVLIDRKPTEEDTKGLALLSGDKENRVFSFSGNPDTHVNTHLFRDLDAYKQPVEEMCRITGNGHGWDHMMIKRK